MASTTEIMATAADPTKELRIQSNGYQCMVEVTPSDTFADVREKILDEFDDDMLPSSMADNDDGDFTISVKTLRLSRKQEARKLAWDYAVRQDSTDGKVDSSLSAVVICLQAKGKGKRKASELATNTGIDTCYQKNEPVSEEPVSERPSKQQRVEEGSVTSTFSHNGADGEEECEEIPRITPSYQSSPMLRTPPQKENSLKGDAATDTDGMVRGELPPPFEADPTSEVSSPIPTKDGGSQEVKSGEMNLSEEDSGCKDSKEEEDDDDDDDDSVDDNDDNDDDNNVKQNREKEGGEEKAGSREDVNDSFEELNVDDEDNILETVDDSDDLSEMEIAEVENPNKKYDDAVASSRQLLTDLTDMLRQEENTDFCVQKRRDEWTAEMKESLKKTAPDTIIGVLGNTGVGKSSLLNALLDEANVLPTSGSRGCTAAVVELRFNKSLLESQGAQTTVYKGQVEFISLQDWQEELKLLIDECSTQDTKTIYANPPDESRQPDAAAAWAKIDEVYGNGTMEFYKQQPKASVLHRLSTNQRVVQLLRGLTDREPRTIVVEEGVADEAQCQMLCNPLSTLRGKLRRTQKKWACGFRDKINDFVYRRGNGSLPQTWPLIRKVVLHGPWAVLSTGACLVDLPGVRDANAARARVAQTYLQNCNLIAVVAPIQRAVDDGSAKELMGEQFKRRLLMDGQYGNVIFICTQTDSCEATEILRDHADVAQRLPGRFEKMTSLQEEIYRMAKEVSNLHREENELKDDLDELIQEMKGIRFDIRDLKKTMASNDDGDDFGDDAETLNTLEKSLRKKKKEAACILNKMNSDSLKSKKDEASKIQRVLEEKQRLLKSMAAAVRNEYSTECLQNDFKAGLEELINSNDDGEYNAVPLPNDYELEVHCICSNDYLKIQGIKSATDGKAGTFSSAEDTNIPRLRDSVFQATARFRQTFARNYVESASDMLDRINLCATQDKEDVGSVIKFRRSFDIEINALDGLIQPIASAFIREAENKVNTALQPSLALGAQKGSGTAMSTVASWGSKNRRSRQHRSPHSNGLYWSTYHACVRRNGVYVSASAGAIDMNQELCDPMEKEFSSEWQQIMDGALLSFIREAETALSAAFTKIAQQLVNAFAEAGMDRARLQTMAATASRTCSTAIRIAFEDMRKIATDSQRELNRSLLPKVANRMTTGYTATSGVPAGTGKFDRMKSAMNSSASMVVQTMFTEATQDLLAAIAALIKQISGRISGTSDVISRSLSSVYSVCWDDQKDNLREIDPAMQDKVRLCRDKLIPFLVGFRNNHDQVMASMGIKREEMELEIVAVEGWEVKNQKAMAKAKEEGNYFEILDSDDDSDEEDGKPAAILHPTSVRVKAEPGSQRSRVKPPKARITAAEILRGRVNFDSDNDEDEQLFALPTLHRT